MSSFSVTHQRKCRYEVSEQKLPQHLVSAHAHVPLIVLRINPKNPTIHVNDNGFSESKHDFFPRKRRHLRLKFPRRNKVVTLEYSHKLSLGKTQGLVVRFSQTPDAYVLLSNVVRPFILETA